MNDFWKFFAADGALITGGSYSFDKNKMETGGEIIIYQAPDAPSQIEVRMEGDTVWLTQKQMAELFGTTTQNITIHLKNIFDDAELDEKSTCKDFLQVQIEGRRRVERKQQFYSLDAILSVGYRINSRQGTQFRIWATQRLKDYLVKGYAVNESRLKQVSENIKRLDYMVKMIQQSEDTELQASEIKGLLKIISKYTESFVVLNQFDKGEFDTEKLNYDVAYEIKYEDEDYGKGGGAGTRTLYVKPTTIEEIAANWGTGGLPYKEAVFARCNAKGEVNWDTTLIYTQSELRRKENVKVLFASGGKTGSDGINWLITGDIF